MLKGRVLSRSPFQKDGKGHTASFRQAQGRNVGSPILSHLRSSFVATPLRRYPSATARLLTQQRKGAPEGKGGGRRASGAAMDMTAHPANCVLPSPTLAMRQINCRPRRHLLKACLQRHHRPITCHLST